MASQRHKREHRFEPPVADWGATDGTTITPPIPPLDANEETAAQYGEEAAWPDADRPVIT